MKLLKYKNQHGTHTAWFDQMPFIVVQADKEEDVLPYAQSLLKSFGQHLVDNADDKEFIIVDDKGQQNLPMSKH